jgi:uncharacterized PurR-regulated membrane protein YhhQ (DUF165 family)
LLKGKYFWLRSIGASAIAELLYSSMAVLMIGYGVFSLHEIMYMIIWSYAAKVIYTVILAGPANLVTYWLKKSENISFNYQPSWAKVA